MTVSEYIFDFLQNKGLSTVFMVSGSSAMFLTDALKRNEKLQVICNHHEQAAVMSADIYGRIHDHPGTALVTIGPGATNAITGVAQAYLDSSPLFVLSGQASSRLLKYEQETKIRQHGTQSLNLEPIVSSITKYFAAIMDPDDIRYHMEKAYYEAMNGRKGPVWLDVPIDIQNKLVPQEMRGFVSPKQTIDNINVKKIEQWMASSKKPLILSGGGANKDDIRRLSHNLSIPVVTSRMGIDTICSDDLLFIGRPGAYGDRASHFAIQQCDLLLIVGSRLSVATIGYSPNKLAPEAKKIQVDIDNKELSKNDVPVDYKVNCAVTDFVDSISKLKPIECKQWIQHCRQLKEKYPVVLPEYSKKTPINSYYFTQKLTTAVPEDTVVTVDTGSVCNVVSQTWEVKKGQRYLISGGLSCMGFWAGTIGCVDVPAVALSGDGSVQMNIQEFATLKYYNLPIKLFVYNNNGYLLIKHNQRNYMDDRFLGVGPGSGVQTPDFCKVASAFGLPSVRIEAKDDIDKKIAEVFKIDGPVICEVMLEEFGPIAPRIASRVLPDGSLKAADFDDLFPFLSENEKLSASELI